MVKILNVFSKEIALNLHVHVEASARQESQSSFNCVSTSLVRVDSRFVVSEDSAEESFSFHLLKVARLRTESLFANTCEI